MKPTIEWAWYHFLELSKELLFDLIVFRQDIFVVEQQCIYSELDQKDKLAYHLVGTLHGAIVATLRLLPAGVSYPEASIGRVAVHADVRGSGAGRSLMQRGLDHACTVFGRGPIKISAQAHLRTFYESLGFETIDGPYLEDGIPHLAMLYRFSKTPIGSG